MNIGFSLKTKLLILCMFLTMVGVGVGVIGYLGIQTLSKDTVKIAKQSLPSIRLSDEMFLNYRRVRITLRTLGLPGLSKTDADHAVADAKDAIEQYEAKAAAYAAKEMSKEEAELYKRVTVAWSNFKKVGGEVLGLHAKATPESHEQMIEIFKTTCPAMAHEYTAAIEGLVAYHQNNADHWTTEAVNDANLTNQITLIIIVLGAFLGMGAGYVFANQISKIIIKIASEIQNGAENVAAASRQISESAATLSTATSQQAASVEETSATMEELTSMVTLNSNNAKEATRLAQDTQNIAVQGEIEIKHLVASIQEIAADSKKIEEITSVIDDIAFQTNLLALNAAVEAARAGEQGKGFAVVADAVRTLAQRSGVAAKDISTLIHTSVAKIEAGSAKASHSGVVLTNIVQAVKKVTDLNGEISNASQEQANGIAQISTAVNQLDHVTQENSAAATEAASSSEQLDLQAQNLREGVANLHQIITGTTLKESA